MKVYDENGSLTLICTKTIISEKNKIESELIELDEDIIRRCKNIYYLRQCERVREEKDILNEMEEN